jgi:chloramphenicol 3-O phosphotransferase
VGSVILLNGASSAGKSTLATAIQDVSDTPLLRMSLDFFFFGDVLPKRGGKLYRWPEIRPRLLAGYDQCIAALAAAGNDLVVDHIFERKEHFDTMMRALVGQNVFLVGVHCPIEELERREAARGDRKVGDARRDLETVHTFCEYDFEVDSSLPPERNAALILEAWTQFNSTCVDGAQTKTVAQNRD